MRIFRYLLLALIVLTFSTSAWAGTPKRLKYGARFADEGAAHATPPSGFYDLYVNGDVLYGITDGGVAVAISSAGATAWDDIANPDASDTITFGTYTMTLTGASTAVDQFIISGTGNFGDVSVMKVQQVTGSPTDGTVLEVISADGDVDALVVTANSTDIINVGGSGAITIDALEFDVSGTTGAITINDDGNAGSVTVEGSVFDINSLDFVGVGAITAAASSAITINPNAGDAAGEDLIITAHNVQLTATGAVTMSPDVAVTTALTITDTDYTNALSVGTNAIVGTTGVIDYTNFDVAADGDVTCVDLAASGTVNVGTFAQDNLVPASAAPNAITLNGATSGKIQIGNSSTGNIELGGGTAGQAVDVIATANLVVSEGDLAITSTANEDMITITNNTMTDKSILTGSSTSLTSGKAISITTDAITSGSMIYLDNDQGGSFTGNYILAYDGSGADFAVKLHGEIEIAGNASSDMITITTGDVQIDDGLIAIDTNEDDSSTVTRAFAGAGTAAAFAVTDSNASTTNSAISATSGGTAGIGLTVTATGTGDAVGIAIVHSGDYPALNMSFGVARTTGAAVDLSMTNSEATSGIFVDGAWTGASDAGMLHLHGTGNIASGASMIRLDHDTGSSAADGFMMEIEDDSADAGTIYAILIDSANNEGLHVSAGESLFADQATFSAKSVHTLGLNVDDDIDIDFDAADKSVVVTASADAYTAKAGIVLVEQTDTTLTNQQYLLKLQYTADDNANGDFILCVDDSGVAKDELFAVGSDGAIVTEGSATINGTTLIGDGATQQYGFVALPVDGSTGPVNIEIADSRKVYYNSEACTFNLPPAAAGLEYSFVVAHASQITVEPDGTDRILILTDTNGDKITSSTAGDTITLFAVGAATWYVKSIFPASTDWADGGA